MERKGAEELLRWYLRLNGYFTIDSFIVHAAEDPGRIYNKNVGSHTETDILAVRMPYSKEITGRLSILNHPSLVKGSYGRLDFVIAEVGTGSKNTPNKAWIDPDKIHAIEYIVRFIGLFEVKSKIKEVASSLQQYYKYDNKEDRCRYRYIIVAHEPNEHYKKKGLTYITYDAIFEFLNKRGECWVKEDIGVASVHDQWPDLIKKLFGIANDHQLTEHVRRKKMDELFTQPILSLKENSE